MYIVASGRIRETFIRKADALEYAQSLSESNPNEYTDECTAYVYYGPRHRQKMIAEYVDGECQYSA